MMIYVALAFAAVSGFLIGRWYRQPETSAAPIKIDNTHINMLQARVDELEALCADLHASTSKSDSGTARMVARKTAAALFGQP